MQFWRDMYSKPKKHKIKSKTKLVWKDKKKQQPTKKVNKKKDEKKS